MFHAYAAHKQGSALEPFEYEPAPLAANQVEIEISHCGICHSDVHLIDNDWGNSQYPLVPGHEVVGKVVDTGAAVQALRVGQQVGVGWQSGGCGSCEWCVAGDDNLCASIKETCLGAFGGFADRIRVDHRFAFPIPDALSAGHAAPLLCGGVTVYAPLARFAKPQSRVGVIGIGGLGHMAIRFASAFGCEVTAFSSSPDKEEEARELGAHHFVASKNKDALKAQRETLDLIISTAYAPLEWHRYVAALRANGTLCFVGAPSEPVSLAVHTLLGRQRSISASVIGGRKSITDMLAFAARHNIRAEIETVPMADVNEALNRLRKNDVRYRFVLQR